MKAHPREQDRPDVKAARETWLGQADLDPESLVKADYRQRWQGCVGVAPKGRRCRAAFRHGHWKTIIFVGGVTLSGVIAPMFIDPPMEGEVFLAWCEPMPAPA